MKKQTDLHLETRLTRALAELGGTCCHRTKFAAFGTLILYIDKPGAQKRSLTRWRLYVDSAWRVERNGRVLLGYADADKEVLAALRGLWDQNICSVDVSKGLYDLSVSFDNGMLLRVFSNSIGNEQWELRRSDGFRIGIAPGLMIAQHEVARDPGWTDPLRNRDEY